MAPNLPQEAGSSSAWSYPDASNPKLSLRRYYPYSQQGISTAGVLAVAFGVIGVILIICCCLAALCKKQRPQPLESATIPIPMPTVFVELAIPPPPYSTQRQNYHASMETEMAGLARPTAVAGGSLGKAGWHWVPISDISVETRSSEPVRHFEYV